MDDKQRAEALRVCDEATKGKWGYEAHLLIAPGHPNGAKNLRFVWNARGNAEGTTGYAAVLRAVGIWQEGYARLQGEWDKLFDAGVEYMEAADVCSDGLCEKCAQCRLGKAINRARPPVPPFHFEEAEEAVRKDEGHERLERDAAAYRKLLEAVQAWVGNNDSCMALPGDLDNGCGECPQCLLADLIADAEPCQAPDGDGKRQERPKNGLDDQAAKG